MEQRVSLITLGVADLARSRRFYEDGLGWRASPASMDGIVFFQAGGLVVALYPRDHLARDIGLDDAPAGFSGVTLSYNVREKAEAAAVIAAAVQAGAKLLQPAQDVFWGGHGGYFADPDGHVWEVSWNPFWPIAADGTVSLPDGAA